MDDYFSRVFVEPATKSNHIRNSEGTGADKQFTAKQALSIASRDYFSMNVDVLRTTLHSMWVILYGVKCLVITLPRSNK